MTTSTITESYNLIDGTTEYRKDYMELCPKNKGKYITHNSLSYGDYDNSGSVERSNVAYITENYAVNRYYEVIGAYGYTQIYLKNTAINAELICALSDYPVIDDQYHSKWEYDNAKQKFLELSLNELAVVYKALAVVYDGTDTDISDIENSEYFWDMCYCSNTIDSGNSEYFFQNDNAVFRLTNNDTEVSNIVEYFTDNPMFSKATGKQLDTLLISLADRIANDIRSSDTIYCMIVNSYTDIDLVAGSSDYLSSHLVPYQEIEIDANSTIDDIMSQLKYCYDSICEYSHEYLDKIPTSV